MVRRRAPMSLWQLIKVVDEGPDGMISRSSHATAGVAGRLWQIPRPLPRDAGAAGAEGVGARPERRWQPGKSLCPAVPPGVADAGRGVRPAGARSGPADRSGADARCGPGGGANSASRIRKSLFQNDCPVPRPSSSRFPISWNDSRDPPGPSGICAVRRSAVRGCGGPRTSPSYRTGHCGSAFRSGGVALPPGFTVSLSDSLRSGLGTRGLARAPGLLANADDTAQAADPGVSGIPPRRRPRTRCPRCASA